MRLALHGPRGPQGWGRGTWQGFLSLQGKKLQLASGRWTGLGLHLHLQKGLRATLTPWGSAMPPGPWALQLSPSTEVQSQGPAREGHGAPHIQSALLQPPALLIFKANPTSSRQLPKPLPTLSLPLEWFSDGVGSDTVRVDVSSGPGGLGGSPAPSSTRHRRNARDRGSHQGTGLDQGQNPRVPGCNHAPNPVRPLPTACPALKAAGPGACFRAPLWCPCPSIPTVGWAEADPLPKAAGKFLEGDGEKRLGEAPSSPAYPSSHAQGPLKARGQHLWDR